jgi:hypothetical protein
MTMSIIIQQRFDSPSYMHFWVVKSFWRSRKVSVWVKVLLLSFSLVGLLLFDVFPLEN